MNFNVLAQAIRGAAKDAAANDGWWSQPWFLIIVAVVALVGFIMMIIFFGFIRLWIQSLLTVARIGILDLVGMKLRNVD